MQRWSIHSLTQRWCGFVVQHAHAVLVVAALICASLVPLALTATHHTVSDGWLPETAEAVQVQHDSNRDFGSGKTTHYLVFSSPEGELANDPHFVREVQYIVRPLRALPEVSSVTTWGTTNNEPLNAMLLSTDQRHSIAVIQLAEPPHGDTGTPDWIRSHLAESNLEVQITGLPATGADFRSIGKSDLMRAELLSIPATLLILMFVFRRVVPAIAPVIMATGSVIAALAATSILGRFTAVNVFTVNAVTMLGLAVGIDYALIMVNRFRDELGEQSAERALGITLEHAGRTVVTAGSTVAIGLSGLIFFEVPAATSTAILGAVVVLIAVVLSLTALPAAMFVLASRFSENIRPRKSFHIPRWGFAHQKRSLAIIAICLTLLVILSYPAMQLRAVSPGISNLPQNAESRVAAETIQQSFPLASTAPIEIVLRPTDGSMLDAENLQRYQELSATISQLDGVQRTETLWQFIPNGFTAQTLSTGFLLEPDLLTASKPFLNRHSARITVIPSTSLDSDQQQRLVEHLRDVLPGSSPGLNIIVGGSAGLNLDLINHMTARIPIVLIWIVAITLVVLFAHLRSAILPIKAILLNLASMGASFGATVWIFQEGHLADLLGVSHNGTTMIMVPILMFCFLFGLGMDFEIIMLSRIREEWLRAGDTPQAVTRGLEQASAIVATSAMLMVTVFVAFAFGELDVLKALGIGLAIAVTLDATIIRQLLLPATMHVLGDWNWWPTKRS